MKGGENVKVEWPTFQPRQMLVPGVEVLATHTANTSATGPTMTLTLTSFDGNLYHLPPFKVKVNGKEEKSAENKVEKAAKKETENETKKETEE